jgi:hypothetical protein
LGRREGIKNERSRWYHNSTAVAREHDLGVKKQPLGRRVGYNITNSILCKKLKGSITAKVAVLGLNKNNCRQTQDEDNN